MIKKGLTILRDVKRDFVSWAIIKQLVSSPLSIRANIVEGWYSHKGKSLASYLEISRGSVGESEDWFYALCDEGYIDRKTYESISKDCNEIIAMLTSFVKTLRNGKK